jgi:hypothetical protein
MATQKADDFLAALLVGDAEAFGHKLKAGADLVREGTLVLDKDVIIKLAQTRREIFESSGEKWPALAYGELLRVILAAGPPPAMPPAPALNAGAVSVTVQPEQKEGVLEDGDGGGRALEMAAVRARLPPGHEPASLEERALQQHAQPRAAAAEVQANIARLRAGVPGLARQVSRRATRRAFDAGGRARVRLRLPSCGEEGNTFCGFYIGTACWLGAINLGCFLARHAFVVGGEDGTLQRSTMGWFATLACVFFLAAIGVLCCCKADFVDSVKDTFKEKDGCQFILYGTALVWAFLFLNFFTFGIGGIEASEVRHLVYCVCWNRWHIGSTCIWWMRVVFTLVCLCVCTQHTHSHTHTHTFL